MKEFAFVNGDVVEIEDMLSITSMTEINGRNQLKLTVTMPEGFSNHQLLEIISTEVKDNQEIFFGKEVIITGRLTTHLAMYLGHALAHITQAVYLFDPKRNEYILVIKH